MNTINVDVEGFEILYETDIHYITKDVFNGDDIYSIYNKRNQCRYDRGLEAVRYSLEEAKGWVKFLEERVMKVKNVLE